MAEAQSTWDGGGANANLNNATNWAANVAPTNNAAWVFTGTSTIGTTLINNFAANWTNAGMTFNSGSLDYTFTGNTLTLGGNIINNSTALQTFQIGGILGANRTFNTASGNITWSGNLSGAGGITKTGAQTLTLGGSNSFTGASTITAGTVNYSGNQSVSATASAANFLVINGGTALFDGADTTNNINAGYIQLGSASSVSSLLVSNGAVIRAARYQLGANTGNNSTNTITLSSGGTLTNGLLLWGNGGGTGQRNTVNNNGGILNVNNGDRSFGLGRGNSTSFNIYNQTDGTGIIDTLAIGQGGTGNNNQFNLSGGNFTVANAMGVVMGSAINTTAGGVFITNTINLINMTGGNMSAAKIQFGNAGVTNTSTGITNRVILGGGTMTVGAGGFTEQYTNTMTTTRFTNQFIWNGGVLSAGANVGANFMTNMRSTLVTLSNSGGVFDVNGFTNTIAATISGAGGLTVTNSSGTDGVLTLTGANTYSGGTTLNGGTLVISAVNNLGANTAANALAFRGGTLLLTNGAGIVLNNNLVIQTDTVSVINNDIAQVDFMGSLSGGGTLTKAGSARTYFRGSAASFTGTINKVGGRLDLLADSTSANARYILNGSNGTYLMSGSGTAWNFGSLNGASTLINNITNASLSIGALGENDVFSGAISEQVPASYALGIIKVGAGTLTLSGANSYRGGTTVNAGTLKVGNDSALGTATNTLVNNATLDLSGYNITQGGFSGNGTVTNSAAGASTFTIGGNSLSNNYSGTIVDGASGSIALAKSGTGTQTLSGSNAYTGGTAINNGVLQLGNADAVASSGDISFGGGTLNYLTGITTDLSGRIKNSASAVSINSGGNLIIFASSIDGSNVGGLRKTGSGTLALNASNAYTGTTVINGGVLQIGNADALGSLGDIDFEGGTLAYGAGITTDVSGRIKNSASSIAIDSGANAITYGSIIDSSNTGGLTKSGTGTLTLSGANAYTGITTVNAGVLRVGNVSALGNDTNTLTLNGTLDLAGFGITQGAFSGSGVITNSVAGTGTFTLGNATGTTFTGNIVNGTGNIALVKNGTGTLTLTGTYTFTGGTTINAGAINLGSSTAMADTEDYYGAGRLILSTAMTGGTVFGNAASTYSGGTVINSTAMYLQGNSGSTGSASSNNLAAGLFGTGTVTIANGVQMRPSTGAPASGFLIGNAVIFSGGTFTQLSTSGDRSLIFTGPVTLSGNQTFANNSTTSALIFNGSIGQSAASALTKTGAGELTLSGSNSYTGGTTLSAGQLNINNNNALGTGSLTINAATTIDNTSGGARTITNAINLNNNLTFDGSANLTQTTGAVRLNASRTLTVNANTLSLGGVVSGTGFALTKAGAGALSLNGTNTYTGGTTLSAGQLNINNDNALGTGALTIAGGTINNTSSGGVTITNAINLNADTTFVGSTNLTQTTGAVTLSTNRTLTVNANTLSLGGIVTGAGFSLTKAGAGALSLNGANTFSGGATLTAGRLNIGNESALGTGAFTISGGSIDNTSGADVTITNALNLNGDFTFAGSANLSLTSGEVVLTTNRAITVSSNTLSLSGVVSGTGFSLTKAGAGTLTLTGVNTYTGNTTISAGTLQIAGDGQLNSGNYNGAIANSGALNYNSWADQTLGGVISGTGSLRHSGLGTLTLTAANTYTGATTINSGRLQLTGRSSSASFAIAGNSILELSVASGATNDNATTSFTGSGTLQKTGAGVVFWGTGAATFAMSAGSLIDVQEGTFTGGANANEVWTANQSSLNVASGATFAGVEANVRVDALSGSGTISSGFTSSYQNFTFGVANGSGTFSGVLANRIGGAGTANYVKTGSGTQTLTGSNSYTGTTTISGGELNFAASSALGTSTNASASFIINGGSAIFGTSETTNNVGFGFTMGTSAGAVSSLFVTNGAVVTLTNASTVGSGGNNSVNQIFLSSGGTILNTLTGTTTDLRLGNSGSGQYNAIINDGGSLVQSNSHLAIGRNSSSSTNVYSQTAGSAVVRNLFIGIQGTGNVNQLVLTGGTFTTVLDTLLGSGQYGSTSQTNTLNLMSIGGGSFSTRGLTFGSTNISTGTITNQVVFGGGTTTIGSTGITLGYTNTFAAYTNTITWDGGVLRASAAATSFLGNLSNTLVTIGSNGGVFDVGGFSNTIAANMVGTGGLRVTNSSGNSGALTLSGTNSFSGDIAINAGTLQIGGAGQLGNGIYAGAISNDGLLNFNSSSNQILSGSISGSGSLTRSGVGVLTLSASNNYSGGTLITGTSLSGGIIATAGDALGSGNVTVNSGYSLALSGGITLTNDLYGSGVGSSNAATGGGFAAAQRGFVQAMGAGTSTYAGNIYVTGTSGSRIGAQDGSSLNITGSIISTNSQITFRVGGADSYIILSNTNTWAQDALFFGGGTNGGIRLGVDNALSTNVGIGLSSTSTFNIDLNGKNQTLRNIGNGTTGTILINNSSDTTTSVLTLNTTNAGANNSGSNTIIADGPSGGKVALVKNGSGTQTLQGASTYSGGTTLNDGDLVAGNANALGTGSLTVNGGTLNLNGFNLSQASLTQSGGTLGTNGSTNTLSATNGYALNGGTVNANLGSGTITVGGDATLNGTAAADTVNVNGGTLRFGANDRLSNTASVNVRGGRLDLQGFNEGVGEVTLGNGTITGTGTLTGTSYTATNSGDASIEANLAGGGSFTKGNSGTLTLTGANTYSGGTTINAGTMAVTRGDSLGSGTVSIGNNAIFGFSGGGDTTIANDFTVGSGKGTIQNFGVSTLTLAGTLTKTASILQIAGGSYNVTGRITGDSGSFNSDLLLSNAAVTLSGANDYVGPTYVTAGSTLTAGSASALPSSTVLYLGSVDDISSIKNSFNLNGYNAVIGGLNSVGSAIAEVSNGGPTLATMTINGAGTSTYLGSIGASGADGLNLEVAGGQTLNLLGNNSYTGTTTIGNNSSINLGSSGSLAGTSAVNLNGGTLLLGGNNQVNTNAILAMDAGTLSMGGNGSTRAGEQNFASLTLTGNSTIDFSSLTGNSTLSFGSITGLDQYTLSIWNWSDAVGNQTKLYDTGGGLSFSELANISFYSGAGSGFLATGTFSSGNEIVPEIVPIPEPGVVLSALLLVGCMLYSFRAPLLRLARR